MKMKMRPPSTLRIPRPRTTRQHKALEKGQATLRRSLTSAMLKWAVGTDQRRRREWSLYKRRRLNGKVSDGHLQQSFATMVQERNQISTKQKDKENQCTSSYIRPLQNGVLDVQSGESESTSLFYMTLDHLPLAILKQYEKMLQETEQELGKVNQQTKGQQERKHERSTGSTGLVMCGAADSQGPKVKEALHRPLKVANISVKPHNHDTILLSGQKYSDDSEGESSSSSDPWLHETWGEFRPNKNSSPPGRTLVQTEWKNRKSTEQMSRNSSSSAWNHSPGERRTSVGDAGSRQDFEKKKLTFDQRFQEKGQSAKLSLKRRELRKLEKLRGESEELSAYLRKYYSDCLPKLPPEDEGGSSPEDKSLLTSFLDQLASRMRDWDKGQAKYCARSGRKDTQHCHRMSSTSTSTSTTTSESSESSESTTQTDDEGGVAWSPGGTHDLLPMIPEDPELSSSDQAGATREGSTVTYIPKDVGSGGLMKIIEGKGEEVNGPQILDPFDPPPTAQQRFPSSSSSNFIPDIPNYSPGENYENHFPPASLGWMGTSTPRDPPTPLGRSPWKNKRKKKQGRVAVGVRMRNIKTPSTKTGVGEVLVRSQWTGNSLTLDVLEVRNLQRFPSTLTSPSWKLSFKVSFLPAGDSEEEEEKVHHSPWLEVQGGERRLSIQQKFSFITSPPSLSFVQGGRKGGKFFITFWKRCDGKRNYLLGWTSKEVGTEEESDDHLKEKTKGDSWLRLRRDKMRKNHLTTSQPTTTVDTHQIHCEGEHFDLNDLQHDFHRLQSSSLINSGTMDSGVEDCCNSRTGPPSSHLIFQLQKGAAEEGFGFTVIWCSPPQIGRIKERTAAERSGLRTGDLIIRVNGEDIAPFPKEIVIHKMQWNGDDLELEVQRELDPEFDPHFYCPSSLLSSSNVPSPPIPIHVSKSNYSNGVPPCQMLEERDEVNRLRSFVPPTPAPPVSILKPPPPPVPHGEIKTREPPEPRPVGTSWKIRFNVEFLEKEDEIVKEFLLTELKFFRKVVAALDRYLIPAQANCLLTNAELTRIFSHLIKIITITKRILDCVSHGGGALGQVLLRTHSDHLVELLGGYSSYAKNLGSSASLLAEKMRFQLFAEFVVETPVPKGHLDMTSLLFAPLEHLRNLCEIADEILLLSPEWTSFAHQIKECYADIVCETDFMEPISHVSMKKQPLLSVRHLEKRIVSMKFQEFKVCEKGRRWLFGSRLFRKESDGSFSPVWAFLFTDLLVLTSHHTRTDRVFFVKDAPVKLQDVTTLHFNIPKKHENEFRLLFGGEMVAPQSRLDRLFHKGKGKKPPQLVLRTPNTELKCIWKLLLQRQIIVLNTRLSKSSSSNFSISEFCEKFPERDPEDEEINATKSQETECQESRKGQEVTQRQEPMTPPTKVNQIQGLKETSISPILTVKVPNEEKEVVICRKGDEGVELKMEANGRSVCPPVDGLGEDQVEVQESIPTSNTHPQCPPSTCPSPRRRAKKVVVHKDSPMISGEGRRRILYDCKVRKDYPELFGISPRDRRSFIKSLGQKVGQSVDEDGGDGMVTPVKFWLSEGVPYYYISPAPSPLPLQKQWRKSPAVGHPSPTMSPLTPVRRVIKEREVLLRRDDMTPVSLPLGRLNLVQEEERERSPEESSSNDSGISDDPGQCPLTLPLGGKSGGSTFLRQSEVTPTTSALTRVLENHQPETQGKVARLVGVRKADKATETDDRTTLSHHDRQEPPLPHSLLNYQRRLAFFHGHIQEGRGSDLPPKPLPPEPFIVKIVNSQAVPMSPLKRSGLPHVTPSTYQVGKEDRRRTADVEYTLLEEVRVAKLERVESSEDSNESTSSDVASASPAGNENGTTDPSWSSSSSSLAKEEGRVSKKPSPIPTNAGGGQGLTLEEDRTAQGPQILITKESPTKGGESNESTVENYGDDDDDYFDEEEDFSHSSVVSASMNRYGTYESLERLENEDLLTGLPEFCRAMPRSKARFAFDEEEDGEVGELEEEDLFEEDFESDFNFRFPSQIQDNTYSVSRLGPLPPLLEEDYEEDEIYTEGNPPKSTTTTVGPSEGTGGAGTSAQPHSSITSAGFRRGENSFLLSRIATMYARSSISPLKIFRDLWLKKRYRDWGGYKE